MLQVYSNVPTPKEVDLSKQLLVLRRERDENEARLLKRINEMEAAVHQSEAQVTELTARLQSTRREQAYFQEEAVLKERKVWEQRLNDLQNALEDEKFQRQAQEHWQQHFAKGYTTNVITDPVEKILTQFSQQVAFTKNSHVPALVRAGCVEFLIQILRDSQNDLVIGPTLIALVHLSISTAAPHVRHVMVKAQVLPPLLILCEHSNNPAILTQCVKLIASLALYPPNKAIIASKNGIKLLVRLINAIQDDTVQPAAKSAEVVAQTLTALENLSFASETIRSQITALGGVLSIVAHIYETPDIHVRTHAARLMTNMACNHMLNQASIMSAEGDVALNHQLGAEETTDEILAAGTFLALSNLAHTDVNQASIGYSRALPLLVRYTVETTEPALLIATTTTMASLMYSCCLNKNRLALERAVEALLYLITEPERFDSNPNVLASTCRALSSFLITEGNCRLLRQHEGATRALVEFCVQATDVQVVRTSAMVLAALVPIESTKHEFIMEGKLLDVEEEGGLAALERARYTGYVSCEMEVPKWLENAIRILKTPFEQLRCNPRLDWFGEESLGQARRDDYVRPEFFQRTVLSEEYVSQIEPDDACKDTFY